MERPDSLDGTIRDQHASFVKRMLLGKGEQGLRPQRLSHGPEICPETVRRPTVLTLQCAPAHGFGIEEHAPRCDIHLAQPKQ